MQTKDEGANLNMIKTLREKIDCDVGCTRHEMGLAISYSASVLKITSHERRINLDRSTYGSDQSASVEPAGFRQLVGAVRKVELAMGDGVKRVYEAEKPIAENLRQHITL